MRSYISLAALLATAALCPAQVLHPDVKDRATESAGNNNNNGGNNGGGSTSSSQGGDKKGASPYGNELPFFDPSAETISWNGHTWAGTDNRLMAARFERYLNEPEDNSEAAKEYRQTIADILEKISPHHKGGPDFAGGVALLPRASSFPIDAKLCDSLSQAIYTAVLAKKDVAATRALNAAMEEEKKRLIRNSDISAKAANSGIRQQAAPTGGGGGGGNGGNGGNRNGGGAAVPVVDNNGMGTGSLEYQDNTRRILEIEVLKKANMSKGEIQILQAKIQYQALMMQFFVQRRFEHVLMASRFYNQIFKDGDSRLHIDKNSDMSKLFSESLGTSPTVSALDSLASEAIRDVDQGVEAFKFLVEKSELQSAAKRLSEAYVVGEFMPSIRTLPREDKRKVLEFVRESYKLIAALDAKDYTTAKALTEKLKKTSGDFDSTKPEAAIATYTRVSDMHIMSAKNHAANKEVDKAKEEIQKAMEVWPQNPKLAEFDRLVEASGTMIVAKNDFDRLLSEGNYREIFRRQYELAPSISGDVSREEAFKQIITNLTRIEAAIGKANEFSKMDQSYAAWEQLADIRKEFPDDPKLGSEIEKLSGKVARFTEALDKARSFEERKDKQVGSALTWYLKAQAIYPRSEMADAGIQRMLEEIIPDRNSKSAASEKEVGKKIEE